MCIRQLQTRVWSEYCISIGAHLSTQGWQQMDNSCAQQPQVVSTAFGKNCQPLLNGVCLPQHLVQQIQHYNFVPVQRYSVHLYDRWYCEVGDLLNLSST